MINRFALRTAALAVVIGTAGLAASAQTTEPQPAQPAPMPQQPAMQPATQPAPAASSAADEDRVNIQLAFTRADADADGKLSPQEAGRLPAVAARFSDLDADKDGFISNAEFNAGVRIQR